MVVDGDERVGRGGDDLPGRRRDFAAGQASQNTAATLAAKAPTPACTNTCVGGSPASCATTSRDITP
jgi:hypothetical protein